MTEPYIGFIKQHENKMSEILGLPRQKVEGQEDNKNTESSRHKKEKKESKKPDINSELTRAIPLTDNLMKIECWSRSSSNGSYCFAWDWVVFDTNENQLSFEWVDSEHSGFTIFAKDSQNKSYWKKTERVLFAIESSSFKYSNVSEYLNRSGWDTIFD